MSDIISVGSLPCICLFTFLERMTNRVKKRPVQHSSAFSTGAKDLARMRCSPQRTAFYHQRRITAGVSDGTTIRESFTLQPRVAGEGSKT